MRWFLLYLVVGFVTEHWLVVGILVGIFFWYSRVRSTPSAEHLMLQPHPSPISEPSPTYLLHQDLADLSLLRLELRRLRAAGELDAMRYARTTEELDALSTELLSRQDLLPKTPQWKRRRAVAWELLRQRQHESLGLPPWFYEEPTEQERAVVVPPLAGESLELLTKTPSVPPLVTTPSVESTQAQEAPTSVQSGSFSARPEAGTQLSISKPDQTVDAAWRPDGPSALERALRAMSGWPAFLVPFLAQHIFRFIGAFCGVAASILLVSASSGPFKTLTVSIVLSVYTLVILWGGYSIRRRWPEMVASSNVLLTLGVLLIPLNITSAVRLTQAASTPVWYATGLAAAAVSVVVLYVATTLVSSIMDRALRGRHPQVFLALAALQLAVPVLACSPSWPLLACLHLLLLGILGYGLVLFTKDWLHSIFVERRTTAYYAAGTLVYAALVSFAHLTFGYQHLPQPPRGYYGPFLMALCGLLFYVDAQLKQWTTRFAYLSRVSFALYGLSVLALLTSIGAPTAQVLMLLLGVGVYGTVVWQYLTLPPLYLLFLCIGWLYALAVLQHLPPEWYLLASLPGLASLFAASRWLQKRRSAMFALVCDRICVGTATILTAWSLLHAQPGLVAMSTALAMMAVALFGLQSTSSPAFGHYTGEAPAAKLGNSSWPYMVTLMGSVAVAYAPHVGGDTWATQCAFGLTLIALVWATLGLRLRQTDLSAKVPTVTVLLNSALVNLGLAGLLAVTLAMPGLTDNQALPLLLALLGGVLLWLSLALRVQGFVYGTLALWGAAGVIIKLTYFPQPSAGTAEIALALAVWMFLRWMEYEPAKIIALRWEQLQLPAAQQPPLTLLGRLPVTGGRLRRDILRTPLQQTMVLLWAVGMAHLTAHLLEHSIGWSWALSATLAALGALLGAGYFRTFALLPLAILLGLGAWLAFLFNLGVTSFAHLGLAGTLYALLVWQLSIHVSAHPAALRLARVLVLGGNRARAEYWVCWTLVRISLSCVAIQVWHVGLFTPSVPLLLSLVVATVFFWLAGQRYCQHFHSYVVLSLGALGILLSYAWAFPPPPSPDSFQWYRLSLDYGLGLAWTLLNLFFLTIARQLARRSTDTEVEATTFAHSLYRKPLQEMAALVALVAIAQQFGLTTLAWTSTEVTMCVQIAGVLFIAATSLLLANHALREPTYSLIGIFSVVQAIIWAQGLWAHGPAAFVPQLDVQARTDQWLILASLTLGLAALAHRASQLPQWQNLYPYPLRIVAACTYAWTLLGVLVLFIAGPFRANVLLPPTLFVLAVGLFPLLQPFSDAARLRGLAVPMLLSLSLVSSLGFLGLAQWRYAVATVWSFALWYTGNFVLPRFNARWPQWSAAPNTWPWFGLAGVCLSLFGSSLEGTPRSDSYSFHQAGYLTAAAGYLFLMFRNSAWVGFSWLAALALTWAGLAFTVALFSPSSPTYLIRLPATVIGSFGFVLGRLAWVNIVLLCIPLWRTYGPRLSARWDRQVLDLVTPLLFWPSLLLVLWLIELATWNCSVLLFPIVALAVPSLATPLTPWISAVVIGAALTFSFLHAWWWHRGAVYIYGLLIAVFCTLTAVWIGVAAPHFHLPLFLALWGALLLLVHCVWTHTQWEAEATLVIRQTLSLWLAPSLAVAIAALAFPAHIPVGEWLGTLALLIGVAGNLGWQRGQRDWLLAAVGMFVIFLHAVPRLWVPAEQLIRLCPWYALQAAVLTWLAVWGHDTLRRHLNRPPDIAERHPAWATRLAEVRRVLALTWPWLATLALAECALHGFFLVNDLIVTGRPQWVTNIGDPLAALTSAVLLLALSVRQARCSQRPEWVYGIAVLGAAVGGYVRLLVAGLTPVGMWDTAAIMAVTYALFTLQQFTRSEPLLHVVMVLPWLTLLTVPLQLGSPHAANTFITAGVLYLMTYRETERRLPMYLALLAFNAALYLWVPNWADHYQVIQVYVTPAALSVLLLLHLHRKELKPSVLSKTRLATMSVLYASITGDVFLYEGLAIFCVMLVVSLAGIVVGIALRVRAFLYTGVATLVLNVAGQLVMRFPEQRFAQAIVLLVLATVFISITLWLDRQREAILQRVRIFRADLETWT